MLDTDTKRSSPRLDVFPVHASSPTPTIAELTDAKDEPVKESEEDVILDEDKAEAAHANANFPDGGWRAWLVVFGAMCNAFSTFGLVNSWGIFQEYYQQHLLKDTPPYNIAWIGSIQYSLVFLPALIVGRLFDLGYFRSIFLSSSALLVVSCFLVAECKEYWQFVLCQGIASGLACGGIFGPTASVIAHWFNRRRGLAMGLVAVGSSMGGTVFPIVAHNLIPVVGFQWTMRIIGFILMFVLAFANMTLKRRLPPIKASGGLLNLRAFKSAPFTIYCISAFVIFLGLYTVLTYVNVSASLLSNTGNLSFYLVAIANASSMFGRYAAGLLSDSIGPMNVMIPFTTAAGILTYAWPFARTRASLIVVTILYGISSGSYVSLLANPMMEFGDTKDVGRRLGMFMTILSLGALAGPPISGAINTATGGFEAVGYYAGSTVLLGVSMMCIVRHLVLGRIGGKL